MQSLRPWLCELIHKQGRFFFGVMSALRAKADMCGAQAHIR